MPETQFDVSSDGRARDCDGILNFKKTRENMGYGKLAELIGGLVMRHDRVTVKRVSVKRDLGETWITGHTKTDEGFREEEIWYCEVDTEPFQCVLCGQKIDDGKPSGCGGR